jgi:hypothetical protein
MRANFFITSKCLFGNSRPLIFFEIGRYVDAWSSRMLVVYSACLHNKHARRSLTLGLPRPIVAAVINHSLVLIIDGQSLC